MKQLSDERYQSGDEWSMEGVGEPIPFPCSDYDAILEDLRILGWTRKELADRLGRNMATVSWWKRHGIPVYVKAYVDLAFEVMNTK